MKTYSGFKTWTTRNGTEIIRVMAGRSNVFLLIKGEQAILVDTGIRILRTFLTKRLRKLVPGGPVLLILTHAHFDHAGNAQWIRETFHPGVFIHSSETANLETGYADIPEGTVLYSRILVKLLSKFSHLFARFEPCCYDLTTDDHFDLNRYGFAATILHTPGHTPGSVSIVVDNEFALVGDSMFGIFPDSVLPPFAMDVQLLLQSWEKLLNTGCIWFLPSHGSAVPRQLVEKEYNKMKKEWKNQPLKIAGIHPTH